jgi:uncharacterized protein YndB with AHSA1/START domain
MSKPQLVYVTYIASTPEKVWEALTRSEFTKQFFLGRTIELECRVGGRFALIMPDGGVDASGKVLACEPPHLLSVTWRVEWLEEARNLPEAIVTFRIDPAGKNVRLTLEQTTDPSIPEKFLEAGRNGWAIIISGLKTLLETGRALEVPTPEAPK